MKQQNEIKKIYCESKTLIDVINNINSGCGYATIIYTDSNKKTSNIYCSIGSRYKKSNNELGGPLPWGQWTIPNLILQYNTHNYLRANNITCKYYNGKTKEFVKTNNIKNIKIENIKEIHAWGYKICIYNN